MPFSDTGRAAKKDRIWDACGTRESRDPWGRGKS